MRFGGEIRADAPLCECGERHNDVDVYPVGVLGALIAAKRWPERRRRILRQELRTLRRHVRKRQWRDLQNDFNGYLAEPYHFPEHMSRCGSGWTKARAMRSLVRHGWTS